LALPDTGEQASSSSAPSELLAFKKGYAAGHARLSPALASETAVITLPRGVTLRGRVTAADGTPIAGVGIAIMETGLYSSPVEMRSMTTVGRAVGDWATSDPDGRFAVHVHPVPHQLAFRKAGLAPRLVEGFDPRAGRELSVVMEAGVEVRGRVLRPDGRAAAEASVTLPDAAEGDAGTTTTASDGSFAIPDLAAGPYELTVPKDEAGIELTRTVTAPAADLRVEVPPAYTLRGRVLDAAT